jgi:hypothetical protein
LRTVGFSWHAAKFLTAKEPDQIAFWIGVCFAQMGARSNRTCGEV